MTTAKLTPQQAAACEWAIDPMADHWCCEDGAHARDGILYADEMLPRITGQTLTLSPVEEINDDLLYRLEEQLPDMAEQSASDQVGKDNGIKGIARAAINAAAHIRRSLELQAQQ